MHAPRPHLIPACVSFCIVSRNNDLFHCAVSLQKTRSSQLYSTYISVSTIQSRPSFHPDPATPVYTSPLTCEELLYLHTSPSPLPSPSYLDYISLTDPSTFSHLSPNPFDSFLSPILSVCICLDHLSSPFFCAFICFALENFCSILFLNKPNTCKWLSKLLLFLFYISQAIHPSPVLFLKISSSPTPIFTSTQTTHPFSLFSFLP